MAKRLSFGVKLCFILDLVLLFCGVSCQSDFSQSQLVNRVQACDVCKCSEPIETNQEDFLEIECVYKKDREFALSSLIWPELNSKNIAISIVGFEISSVPKLPKNAFVDTLKLNFNNIKTIWPMAFSDLTNLQYLSLADNQLNEVTPDMFSNLKMLKELDLSNNKLSEFNKLDFSQLKLLKILSLGGNSIVKVPIQTLNKIESLETLILSRNKIFLLNFVDGSEHLQILENLKILDISYNKLTVIAKDSLERATSLEYLDLSHNEIQNIDIDAFKNCKSLKSINLSWNEMLSLTNFPPSLLSLNVGKNMLKEWPTLPEGLTHLDISQNELYNMYNENYIFFDNIKVLNISRNHLQTFEIVKPLKHLSVLDISYNSIEAIPTSFDMNSLPSINDLTVDGNPMVELVLKRQLQLMRFSARNMNRITSIKEYDLNIKPKSSPIEGGTDQCVDISISHCAALSKIEEKAFKDISICHLDLSYNKLTTLSKIDTPVSRGINLQGNPWDCSCNLQWILDDLLEDFYLKHSALLHELRCDSPRQFNGLRFVHWYQWGDRAFCSDSKKSNIRTNSYTISESTSGDANDIGGHSIIMIILFIVIIILFIIVAALIVYLVKGKMRQNAQVRRKTARHRQTPSDFQHARMNQENVVLNNA